MSKINICFFCSLSSLNTGMPLSTLKLISAVSKDDSFNVHVILPAEGDFSKSLQNLSVKVKIIPFSRIRSVIHIVDFVNFLAGYLPSLFNLSKYIRKNHIKLIHFSDIIDSPFFPGIMFTKALAVAHLRTNVNKLSLRLLFIFLAHIFLNKLICVSKSVKNNIGVSDNFSTVIYNPGPDIDIFNRHGVKKDKYITQKGGNRIKVCSIGSIVHVKGHSSIIKTASILNKEHPGKISFFITGGIKKGHYNYKKSLDMTVKKNGLEDNVFFLGEKNHDEIPSLLASSDIFLHLPHYQEPFAGVILEAMAMSLPVVAFDSGGTNECFVDNESGFLVEQFNCRKVSEMLMMLANDTKLRKKIGEQARKHLVNSFSINKHYTEINKIYNNVIKSV